jgi:hypothetical protein
MQMRECRRVQYSGASKTQGQCVYRRGEESSAEKQRRRAIRAPQDNIIGDKKGQQKGEEVDKELRTRNSAVSSPAAKAKTQAN